MKSDFLRLLAQIETNLAELGESDSEWWPFVFLRPAPSDRLDAARCAFLAALYALPAVLLSAIAAALIGAPLDAHQLALLGCAALLACFALFRFVLAVLWNRRANRLAALAARRTAWQRGDGPSR